MKKLVLVILIVAINGIKAQDQYSKGMQKAMELWSEQKTVDASNLFERIATAEMDNWLPYYYVAMVNITASFGEEDEQKLSLQLEKAKEYIDMAKNISPDNVEILVLEAMMNTAWIAFDGATYGMTLSGKNVQLYKKAAELAPENPRVVFGKAEWDMGAARYFGKDTAPYCKDIERALQLFATFKPETEFHPNWGKERAEQIAEECKS
ncbi:hypothetical protein ACFSQJ_08695 [Croceitalea marina]|uniref:Tetratricopeptide repeat protein n=1 Tax=Croceitalea marina TaxID=1775166 RepID=A0ABW5MUT0_9FLAO